MSLTNFLFILFLSSSLTQSGKPEDWNIWRLAKNRTNNLVRDCKHRQEESDMISIENDISGRAIWNKVKQKAGWITSMSPASISHEGIVYTSPKKMADIIKKCLIQKIELISKQLEGSLEDPLEILMTFWNRWGKKNNVPVFTFKKITPARTKEIIKELKCSHGECLDGLSNYILKVGIDSLVHPLTYLFNCCIESQIFLNKWKLFRILPFYKNKGNRDDPVNYRPLALLNPLSKVIEKELTSQMYQHMIKNGLFNRNMYAYRKNYNTTNALIDLMETWTHNIDDNKQNISIFIDMSSVFDCVVHSTLKNKMKIYNFSDGSVNLVYNYLSYRSQCVTVNGINSGYKWVKTGIPQGSIIGPFLYNLFTMEIPNTISVECPHTTNIIDNEDYLFP